MTTAENYEPSHAELEAGALARLQAIHAKRFKRRGETPRDFWGKLPLHIQNEELRQLRAVLIAAHKARSEHAPRETEEE